MLMKILRMFNTLAAVRVAMHIHVVLRLSEFITFSTGYLTLLLLSREKKVHDCPQILHLTGDHRLARFLGVIQPHYAVFMLIATPLTLF